MILCYSLRDEMGIDQRTVKHFKLLLLITLAGLLLRVGYALVTYEPSLLNYHSGDYREYKNAAEDILQGDLEFKNSVYLVRPPLFPLLAAALGIQPTLILAVNILLGAVIIPLTYVLARHFAPPPRLFAKAGLAGRRIHHPVGIDAAGGLSALDSDGCLDCFCPTAMARAGCSFSGRISIFRNDVMETAQCDLPPQQQFLYCWDISAALCSGGIGAVSGDGPTEH